MWPIGVACRVQVTERTQQLVELMMASSALVVGARAAGEIFNEAGPAVLPRRPKLHFNAASPVASVDVDRPVAGITRALDVIDYSILGAVTALAVGSETALDSSDSLQRWQDGSTAADVLHSRQPHRGFPTKLVPHGVAPLEALRNLGLAADQVTLGCDARLQAHASGQHREAVRCPKRLHDVGGIKQIVGIRCRR